MVRSAVLKKCQDYIGKIFFKLLYKQFSPSHSVHKIFNKKSVKISCSCMRSMSSIISPHNCSILNPPKTSFGCNGWNRSMCPLQSKYLTPNIVYQVNITNNVDDERRVYLGLSKTPFQDRYRNHVRSFNNWREVKKNKFSNLGSLNKSSLLSEMYLKIRTRDTPKFTSIPTKP